jgi:hypothetical protein
VKFSGERRRSPTAFTARAGRRLLALRVKSKEGDRVAKRAPFEDTEVEIRQIFGLKTSAQSSYELRKQEENQRARIAARPGNICTGRPR